MKFSIELFEYEREYLTQALRRDFRSEIVKAEKFGKDADYHRFNSRKALQLLDLLNPRTRDRSYFDQQEVQHRASDDH